MPGRLGRGIVAGATAGGGAGTRQGPRWKHERRAGNESAQRLGPATAASAYPSELDPSAEPLPRDVVAAPAPTEGFWRRLTVPGLWGALAFTLMSLTPSLLPRTAVTQGVVTGISAAIGYGLGVLIASIARAFADRAPQRPTPRSWQVLAVTAVVTLLPMLVLARVWQNEVRDLMGVAHPSAWRLVLVPFVAAPVFAALVGLVRLLATAGRRLGRWLAGWMGPRAARALGAIVVATVAVLVVSGLLLDGFIAVADQVFATRDTGTHDDATQPTSGLRSGGPGSLIAWDTLGRQGRGFTGRGPTDADIAAFHGAPAMAPIRTYAGLATAAETEVRARLAVDDLERAGGFERAHLLVTTTTGTGWLDPGSMAAFEHVAGGDSAIVGLQYSFLPSWISYLVDKPRAREAGRALFDAVYERWIELPQDQRPRLYVTGESLGSFGMEAAFSGEADLRIRTDGALFTGPPRFNPLYGEFTRGRDAGSPEVEPVYRDGRTVRFVSQIERGIEPTGRPWEDTRVLYVQHPSDPVVWWGAELLLSRPDWLREPRGHDVSDAMRWFPLVTFWQVTIDMPFAAGVPDGHGHRYTTGSVDAWATLLQPEGWTDEDASRLKHLIAPPD
jgi:uncharacterized membrane protein